MNVITTIGFCCCCYCNELTIGQKKKVAEGQKLVSICLQKHFAKLNYSICSELNYKKKKIDKDLHFNEMELVRLTMKQMKEKHSIKYFFVKIHILFHISQMNGNSVCKRYSLSLSKLLSNGNGCIQRNVV